MNYKLFREFYQYVQIAKIFGMTKDIGLGLKNISKIDLKHSSVIAYARNAQKNYIQISN